VEIERLIMVAVYCIGVIVILYAFLFGIFLYRKVLNYISSRLER
jgi:hypothetical protein